MSHADPIISIRAVTKHFPGVVALDDVSLDISAGELHAIVGENGAGKSTLMKILAGVLTDYEGDILLRGEPYRIVGTRGAETAGVSIIHQELNLVDDLSAAANVFLGREKRSAIGLLDDRAMNRTAGELFAELECDVDPAAPVRQLRVGEKQLVEIAKALSLSAEILIMDEPTSALTEAEVARFDRVVARLRERGTTILYISHKMDEVFRLADRITVLRDGVLIRTLDCGQTNPRQVTHLMVGREIEQTHLDRRRIVGDEVLRVENLSLRRTGDDRWRLREIGFALRRGEIVGVAGLMGAGRTELLECLFGCSPLPPEGVIIVDGQRRRFAHPQEAIAAGLAMVTEDRKRLGLFDQMTVAENVSLCSLAETTVGGLLSRRREAELADSAIERLGVKTSSRDAAITSLSGGNQQKAILARWLLTEPKVLLLDDPTRGVDVGAKAELYQLMDGLCREGLGIIVTSSELPELLTLCDRILVLSEGRLTAEFSRDEATEAKIMEAATAMN
jgi:ABC-type sugar transport system ATPase subunit